MKTLTVDGIAAINERLYKRSLEDRNIEYSGRGDYKTNREKIIRLVRSIPSGTLVEVAAYYLKNIILLQPFPNGNHRTAMIAVRYFLRINGKDFKCDKADMVGFHKRSYTLQSRVYGTLEAMDTSVLEEDTNEFYDACKLFIERHLTDLD